VNPVVFNGANAAQLTGVSLAEHDRKFYAFAAGANQTLTVTLQADINGRYPEVEVRDASLGRELLDLEPRENGRTSGQVQLRPGSSYLIRVHADSRQPVNYTVDLQRADGGAVLPPPVIGSQIVFDAGGRAQLSGSSLNDDDTRFYSFTAPADGVLDVQLLPGSNGRYAELELKDVATRFELLELEPHERPWQTSGRVRVVGGRSYAIKVESSFDHLPSDYTVNLALS